MYFDAQLFAKSFNLPKETIQLQYSTLHQVMRIICQACCNSKVRSRSIQHLSTYAVLRFIWFLLARFFAAESLATGFSDYSQDQRHLAQIPTAGKSHIARTQLSPVRTEIYNSHLRWNVLPALVYMGLSRFLLTSTHSSFVASVSTISKFSKLSASLQTWKMPLSLFLFFIGNLLIKLMHIPCC